MRTATDLPHPSLWRLVWDGVYQNHLAVRASALAFQTLLNLLPLMALTLTVISTPAFDSQREAILTSISEAVLPDSPLDDLTGSRLEERKDLVEHLKSNYRIVVAKLTSSISEVGIFALAFLLVLMAFLFDTVERTMNALWQTREQRSYAAKAAIVTALVIWMPGAIALGTYVNQFLSPHVGIFGAVLPVVPLTVGFTVFYMLMPCAKVRLVPALLGGLTAAIFWELSKAGYHFYLSSVLPGSKLYGSLGLIPIFLTWIYLTWLVILAGARLSYVLQHRGDAEAAWHARRGVVLDEGVQWSDAEAARIPALALAVAIECAARFRTGGAHRPSRSDLAETLAAPPDLLEAALERLTQGGILVQTVGEMPGAQPAKIAASVGEKAAANAAAAPHSAAQTPANSNAGAPEKSNAYPEPSGGETAFIPKVVAPPVLAGGPSAPGAAHSKSAPAHAHPHLQGAAASLRTVFAPLTHAKDTGPRYLPARDPALISLDELLRVTRGPEPELGTGSSWTQAAEVLARVNQAGDASLRAKTLADLLPPLAVTSPVPSAAKPAAPLDSTAPGILPATDLNPAP